MKIGSVTDISFKYLPEGMAKNVIKIPVPARIRIDPARLDREDTPESCEKLASEFSRRVELGMRASLQTGSLLTGNLFVSLDFYENVEKESIGLLGKNLVFPTASRGLAQIEQKVVEVLDTIFSLPLEETFANAGETIDHVGNAIESFNELVKKLDKLIA